MLVKRILVVDDELAVRMALNMLLTKAGHSVETAASASEALAKFEGSEFDLVLTDLRMPGMNGDELAREIKAQKPQLPIILVTGNPPSTPLAEINAVLNKPFSAKDLLTLVENVLIQSAALAF